MKERRVRNILIMISNKINGTWVAALFLTFIFFFVSFSSGNNVFAFGQGGCEGECDTCHALSKTEASDIMKKLKIPAPNVRDIRMSPIKGLWEVTVDSQGKSGFFYIAFSKNYIVQGQIVEVATGVDKTKEQYQIMQDNKKIDISKISLTNALVLGDRKAKKRVIVFTDPDCPFCGRLHDEMRKVVEKRKDIAFYIRLFPLVKLHPDSYWKSKSIVCNKSLQMLEDNFAKRPIQRTECSTKELDDTLKVAERLGITGTPTLIMPSGKMRSGTMSAEQLIELVDGKSKK